MNKVLIADKLSSEAEKIFASKSIACDIKVGLSENELVNIMLQIMSESLKTTEVNVSVHNAALIWSSLTSNIRNRIVNIIKNKLFKLKFFNIGLFIILPETTIHLF